MNQTLDTTALRDWIGRSKSISEVISLDRAHAMAATMDKAEILAEGTALPPVWHWIYFLDRVATAGLGRDGHAAKGEFLPPVPLPRRMWAGGRLSYNRPLHIGDRVERISTIRDVTVKQGATGPLCFVTVRHEFMEPGGETLFSEEHDIVYREDPKPNAPAARPIAPPQNAVSTETITPSPVLLFRYSALTFNSHRIHYDRSYCRDVEGYPGLIFHGPLTATLLADMAMDNSKGRPLKQFSIRATAPLFDTAPFTINSDGDTLYWANTPQGDLAMKAEAVFG